MIKLAFRRNLIYILQYIIWSFARDLLILGMNNLFRFSKNYLYAQAMCLGELLAGTIMYFSQKKYFQKKKDEENKEQYFMSIKLITTEDEEFVPPDSKIKIVILMFLVSLLDIIEFSLYNIYLPRFFSLSKSITQRLYGITTFFSQFFYVYALKLPVYKHHKFSLLIIGICLIAIIVSEFFFQEFDIFGGRVYLTAAIAYIILGQILLSCIDSIHKYLFEYDYMNPFVVLMYEGTMGFFLSFLILLDRVYFYDVAIIAKNFKPKDYALFIGLLIVYIILSGGKNLFRIITTNIYSPMVASLQDYVLNPIYLIYFYFVPKDFTNSKLTIPYFVVNIIISLIISFFGLVYNEFIILFFCGLQRDTHDQVSKRAGNKILRESQVELIPIDAEDLSIEDDKDENESIIK